MTTRRNFLRNSALGVATIAVPAALGATPENSASSNAAGYKEAATLKAGIAREIITPKVGGLLAGYAAGKPSTVIHDDLTVTALAIEYEKTKVVLMSATVCLINNDLTARLRTLCGEAAGVPASNVILAATHTHSGPVIDTDYSEQIFIPKCLTAAKASVAAMKPATMGIAKTESRVGINRRKLLQNDRVILSNNPWGTYDPEMTVISFKDEDNKTFANIVHYAAHCTAAGINTEITRDWAGGMIDRLDTESGGITMFLQGMQGDVGPRLPNGEDKGDIKHVVELGAIAAIDAVRAYKDIRIYRDEQLSVVTGEVRLPHVATTSEESFFSYDQTLIKLGPVVFIPVPFEVSSEISLRLRAYSKYGHTLALGCANGSNSYLVSQDQICRGGYEVERFMDRTLRLVDNTDKHLVNQNLQLMEKFST